MPGGLTLLQSLNADIPTPAAGKITVFFSIDLNTPAYKDDAGAVTTLVGSAGATGSAGPMGSPGFAFDGEEGESYPIALPGPQGNQGVTGAAGPVGPMMVVEDGLAGEDGIPGPAGINSSSDPANIQTVLVNITDAQMRSLDTVPVILVPAQGVGTLILPLRVMIQWNIPTTAFSTTRTILIRLTGGGSTYINITSLNTNGVGNKLFASPTLGSTANLNLVTSLALNNSIEIAATTPATSGATSGGFNVYLTYQVLTTV